MRRPKAINGSFQQWRLSARSQSVQYWRGAIISRFARGLTTYSNVRLFSWLSRLRYFISASKVAQYASASRTAFSGVSTRRPESTFSSAIHASSPVSTQNRSTLPRPAFALSDGISTAAGSQSETDVCHLAARSRNHDKQTRGLSRGAPRGDSSSSPKSSSLCGPRNKAAAIRGAVRPFVAARIGTEFRLQTGPMQLQPTRRSC